MNQYLIRCNSCSGWTSKKHAADNAGRCKTCISERIAQLPSWLDRFARIEANREAHHKQNKSGH